MQHRDSQRAYTGESLFQIDNNRFYDYLKQETFSENEAVRQTVVTRSKVEIDERMKEQFKGSQFPEIWIKKSENIDLILLKPGRINDLPIGYVYISLSEVKAHQNQIFDFLKKQEEAESSNLSSSLIFGNPANQLIIEFNGGYVDHNLNIKADVSKTKIGFHFVDVRYQKKTDYLLVKRARTVDSLMRFHGVSERFRRFHKARERFEKNKAESENPIAENSNIPLLLVPMYDKSGNNSHTNLVAKRLIDQNMLNHAENTKSAIETAAKPAKLAKTVKTRKSSEVIVKKGQTTSTQKKQLTFPSLLRFNRICEKVNFHKKYLENWSFGINQNHPENQVNILKQDLLNYYEFIEKFRDADKTLKERRKLVWKIEPNPDFSVSMCKTKKIKEKMSLSEFLVTDYRVVL